MDELLIKLSEIKDSYFEFVDSVVDYANASTEHLTIINDFLDQNKNATSSDVIHFISMQADFFDDDIVYEEDKVNIV